MNEEYINKKVEEICEWDFELIDPNGLTNIVKSIIQDTKKEIIELIFEEYDFDRTSFEELKNLIYNLE